ncbi:MAG: GyrI-like domain-containing protein [Planctomycetes bacterium]|nr:GyrI-like domain-containing protein [Planctomycetota bacterium]
MLDPLHVGESPARSAAVIRLQVPQKELPRVMGPAIQELLAALQAQGMAPAGPVFSHYLSMDAGLFDFEVGVPVAAAVAPVGRVQPGQLPGGRVVRTTYHGPYEGLHQAWRQFGELARAQGYQPAGGFWESYVIGPETSPEAATWRTELNQLLG